MGGAAHIAAIDCVSFALIGRGDAGPRRAARHRRRDSAFAMPALHRERHAAGRDARRRARGAVGGGPRPCVRGCSRSDRPERSAHRVRAGLRARHANRTGGARPRLSRVPLTSRRTPDDAPDRQFKALVGSIHCEMRRPERGRIPPAIGVWRCAPVLFRPKAARFHRPFTRLNSYPPGPHRAQNHREHGFEAGFDGARRRVLVEFHGDGVDEAMARVEDQRHRAAPIGHREAA